jgi:hypothetical protein
LFHSKNTCLKIIEINKEKYLVVIVLASSKTVFHCKVNLSLVSLVGTDLFSSLNSLKICLQIWSPYAKDSNFSVDIGVADQYE